MIKVFTQNDLIKFLYHETSVEETKEINTSGTGAHPNWPDRFFAQIVNKYLAQTHNRGGRVGLAHCFLIDAKGIVRHREILEDARNEPDYPRLFQEVAGLKGA